MRDCPTIEGSSFPLIVHRIVAGDCLARQQCNYHKCHRCIYRGKSASWVNDASPTAGSIPAANPGAAVAPIQQPPVVILTPAASPGAAATAKPKSGPKRSKKAKSGTASRTPF